MEPFSILIVDDEENIREALREALDHQGYRVSTADSGKAAFQTLKEATYHLVLLDLMLGDIDGLRLLKSIKGQWPDIEVVMITAYGTVETAVEALKEGAYDYMTKPVHLRRLRSYVSKIYRAKRLEDENTRLREELRHEKEYQNIVGVSSSLMKVLELIDQVAPTDVSVLVVGETGTGKELVARAIHQRSLRSSGPFVTINCGALPTELFESELFGYEKGAFTGAHSTKPGRFEMAHNGTLFLDEVAEMAPRSQVDFLRLLEGGRVQRLGSTSSTEVDVRALAATNKDLVELCRQDKFREDLFFRLNVVHINLPPLRDRKEDIPLLAEHFLDEFRVKYSRPELLFTEGTVSALEAYHWPGNIRELRNSVERAVVLCRGTRIRQEHFQLLQSRRQPAASIQDADEETAGSPSYPSNWTLAQVEQAHIARALAHHQGHRKNTAKALGISERDLYYKLKKHRLG
jgi:DNA-binding NtrC family response regulator